MQGLPPALHVLFLHVFVWTLQTLRPISLQEIIFAGPDITDYCRPSGAPFSVLLLANLAFFSPLIGLQRYDADDFVPLYI